MTRLTRRLIGVGISVGYALTLLSGVLATQLLSAQASPSLRIEQLKITTEEQFVTLSNLSENPVDLSIYELVYLNSENKPSKTFTFSGQLPAETYYVMSDALISACYFMQIDAVSLGFSTTSGSLQLWRYNDSATKTLESSVAWIKTRKADTPVQIVSLPTQTNSFLQRNASSEEWQVVQPSADNSCQMEVLVPATLAEDTNFYFLPSMMPPVSYVSAPVEGSNAVVNRNVGKMAPIINEILPNPSSPQTDADDEFIELYNPNDTAFDLTGFKLAFGSTSPKKYTFPEGTILEPKQFKAFTSGDTTISLSNSLGQVWLLAPNEQLIGESKPYQDAKDGQSWALDNGNWVWSSTTSPNQANKISSTASGSSSTKTAAAVLGINSENSNNGGVATTVASAANASSLDDSTPLHPAILAGVGLLAVGYAIYEYRHDISNRIFQFRRYLRYRREVR